MRSRTEGKQADAGGSLPGRRFETICPGLPPDISAMRRSEVGRHDERSGVCGAVQKGSAVSACDIGQDTEG